MGIANQGPENEHGAPAPRAVGFNMNEGSKHYLLIGNGIIGSR